MITIPKKIYETCDGERTLVPAGRYVVRITGVDDSDSDFLALTYETLAPQKGIVSSERFYLSNAALKRFANLCKRLGIAQRGQPFGGDDSMQVDPNALVGRTLVVDVVHEEVPRQKGIGTYTTSKWDFMGFWDVNDPRPEIASFVAPLRQRPAQPAPVPVQRQPQPALNGADSEM